MENFPASPEEKTLYERALHRAHRYLECEAQLLEVISEIDRRRIFEKFGANSTFAYCVDILRLSEATAYTFINVARKAREVPQLAQAIQEGTLSVPKARKIVAVLTQENQAEWIDKATRLPQSKLERAVADANPEAPVREKVKAHAPGFVKVELALTTEEYEAFQKARDILSQRRQRPATAQEVVAAQTECFLDKHDPLRKAERLASAKARRKGRARRSAEIKEHTPELRVAPKEKATPRPENLSREQLGRRRPLKAGLKQAVDLRDQRKCQSCGSTRWLHYHHQLPISEGGTNCLENLVTLCSGCHRRWHRTQDGAGTNAFSNSTPAASASAAESPGARARYDPGRACPT